MATQALCCSEGCWEAWPSRDRLHSPVLQAHEQLKTLAPSIVTVPAARAVCRTASAAATERRRAVEQLCAPPGQAARCSTCALPGAARWRAGDQQPGWASQPLRGKRRPKLCWTAVLRARSHAVSRHRPE